VAIIVAAKMVAPAPLAGFLRATGLQSAFPKQADWKSPLFENNFANFARIFPENYVIAIFALRNHGSHPPPRGYGVAGGSHE
jgi:hypothetical protein